MNHQLIGNTQYDLVIQYFRETTPQERSKLKADLFKSLDWYIDQSLESVFGRNIPEDRSTQMIGDLNGIARKSMAFFRNRQGLNFKKLFWPFQRQITPVDDGAPCRKIKYCYR